MPTFEIAVVDRPAIRTAGLKIRTDMSKAFVDCPAIWQNDFGPRMDAFPADPDRPGESYGLSIMIDDTVFDYWAVMPIAEGTEPPEGMDVFIIPGGKYAECAVPSLSNLGDAYTYIYGKWAATQEKYALNMQAPSCEGYTMDFCSTGALVVYCPLLEK